MKFENITRPPLLCWDIYSDYFFKQLENSKREQDIIKIKTFAEKFNWENDIDAIFKEESFEAIVVTDVRQTILWVNKGFTSMTGYSKTEALNKTPQFLQGAKTALDIRKKIRTQLNTNTPFSAILTNYKKDKTPYECEVKFFQLFNKQTTHFLALEKQV